MKVKVTLAAIVLLLTMVTPTEGQGQKRTIIIDASAPFPFDPIRDRYMKGSLASVVTFVDAWRSELGASNVKVVVGRSLNRSLGFEIYEAIGDSTISKRVLQYLGCSGSDTSMVRRGSVVVVDSLRIGDSVKVVRKDVSIEDFDTSPAYLKEFDEDIRAIKRLFLNPITTSDTLFSIRDSYFGSSAFASLFHAFQQQVSGCEISLFAPPKRDGAIEQGSLYIQDLYRMFSYDNQLVILEISGESLYQFLEYVYSMRYHTIRDGTSDMVRSNLPYYLHDSAAGVEYRINLTKPKGRRVETLTQNGIKVDPRKRYRVCMNSFRATYFTTKGCKVVQEVGDYRILLLKWLQTQECLIPIKTEEWSIAPQRWVEVIKKREIETIFD